MAHQAEVDFGGRLRAAREGRGLSLGQIAQKTKISSTALAALERNDIARLPGGIFARAFVRSYAIEVGLDPDRTVQDFVERFPHDSVRAGRPHAHEQEENQAIESSRRQARAVLTLVGVSVPLAIAVIYLTTSGHNRRPPAEAPPEIPASETRPSASTTISPEPPAAPDVAALRLKISATRPCWVSASVDGEQTLSRLLTEGDEAVLSGRREVVLRAGDASALAVTINEMPAAPFGASGAVVTVRITTDNYRTYLAGR